MHDDVTPWLTEDDKEDEEEESVGGDGRRWDDAMSSGK